MSFDTALGTERFPVVAAIDPDVYTANTYTTSWIDMSLYDRILAVVMAGDLGTSATLNAKLEKSLLESPATAVDVTSKAITALTQASPNDSNKQALINCRADELGPNDGYRYARLSMTVGVQTSDCGAVVIGFNQKFGGASYVNALGSELIAVTGAVDPDAYAPSTVTTGWVDMSRFGRVMAVVLAGDTGATNTIAAKLEQANTSGGGSAKDVTGKTITTVDGTTSPTTANVQRTIDCRADELDIDNSFRWVRLSVTVADTTSPETATSDAAAVLIGLDPRFAPADAYDASSVAEIVS